MFEPFSVLQKCFVWSAVLFCCIAQEHINLSTYCMYVTESMTTDCMAFWQHWLLSTTYRLHTNVMYAFDAQCNSRSIQQSSLAFSLISHRHYPSDTAVTTPTSPGTSLVQSRHILCSTAHTVSTIMQVCYGSGPAAGLPHPQCPPAWDGPKELRSSPTGHSSSVWASRPYAQSFALACLKITPCD